MNQFVSAFFRRKFILIRGDGKRILDSAKEWLLVKIMREMRPKYPNFPIEEYLRYADEAEAAVEDTWEQGKPGILEEMRAAGLIK